MTELTIKMTRGGNEELQDRLDRASICKCSSLEPTYKRKNNRTSGSVAVGTMNRPECEGEQVLFTLKSAVSTVKSSWSAYSNTRFELQMLFSLCYSMTKARIDVSSIIMESSPNDATITNATVAQRMQEQSNCEVETSNCRVLEIQKLVSGEELQCYYSGSSRAGNGVGIIGFCPMGSKY